MHKTLYDKALKLLEKCKTCVDAAHLKKMAPWAFVPQPLSRKSLYSSLSKTALVTKERFALEDDISCRICYSYESPLGCLKDLVSPCGCKGSIKYVHRYCLRVWRFKGKRVQDIKVCEQCFCEYVVDGERSLSKSILGISTIAIMASLAIMVSLFVSSTADTAEFIANDIYAYIYGNAKMLSFDDPILVCNMDAIVARKNSQNPKRALNYTLRKLPSFSEKQTEHFACAKKKCIYSLKNIYLLDLKRGDAFTSVAMLACVYTILFENTLFLFVNFVLSFWRVISFNKIVDWLLYLVVIGYIYNQMFCRIYKCLDNYCMYFINLY